MDKALTRVVADVAKLFEEHREEIKTAMREQMILKAKENPDAKLTFSLTMGSTIEPTGDASADVNTTLQWTVKAKKTTDSQVDEQTELDLKP